MAEKRAGRILYVSEEPGTFDRECSISLSDPEESITDRRIGHPLSRAIYRRSRKRCRKSYVNAARIA
jgi:hypothetical protein